MIATCAPAQGLLRNGRRASNTPAISLMSSYLNPWQWLRASAASATFLMMAVSVVDVVGRKFADKPLRGAVEIIEMLMLLTVFLAWPLVTRNRAHITLDLVDQLMPKKIQVLRERLGELAGGILLLGAAFLAYSRAGQAMKEMETTTLLEIKLGPLYFLVMGLFILTGGIHLVQVFRAFHESDNDRDVAGRELS